MKKLRALDIVSNITSARNPKALEVIDQIIELFEPISLEVEAKHKKVEQKEEILDYS